MIAAIDPGKTGAIALLYPDGTLYVEDMPIFSKEINGAAISQMFREFPPRHLYIEAVNSFGMGRQSAFMFGQGVGVIKGVLAAQQVPYSQVAPAKWKRELSLSKDKDQARAMATRLFPKSADKFKRKKDDGRAEAVLIAHWAKQKEEK